MNYRTKKAFSNIFWGLINKFIHLLLPFIIRTILIQKLGNDYLGLSSLFVSLLQVLSLAELGIGSAMSFAMYKPIKEKDKNKICQLLNLYKKLYFFVGLIILFFGVLLLPFLQLLIKGDVPKEINVHVIYLLYLSNTVLSYIFFSYRKSLFEADQDNSKISKINIFTTLLLYSLQIFSLYYFSNFYIYVALLPCTTLINNVFSYFFSLKKYPYYICIGNLSKEETKIIFSNIFALFGHSLGTTVILSLDSIIISSMLGLNVLAIYSNYYLIISSIGGVLNTVYLSILASIGNLLITETKENNYKIFICIQMINHIFVGTIFICLVCLYQNFMRFWVGNLNMFSDKIMILFCLYFYSQYFRRILLTYKEASGMWRDDFWKPYIGVVINVITNIILVKIIGVSGALISTIIIFVFIYFPWELYIVTKKIFNKPIIDFIMSLVYFVFLTLISVFICYYICLLVDLIGIIGMVVEAIIIVLVSLLIYFTGILVNPKMRTNIKYLKVLFIKQGENNAKDR